MKKKRTYCKNIILILALIITIFSGFLIYTKTSFSERRDYVKRRLINFQSKNYWIFGTNIPWIGPGYGHDLGLDPLHPDWGRSYDNPQLKADFNQYLKNCKENGMHVIRIWLFERSEGLIFDNSGAVVMIEDGMLNNILDVMNKIGENDLYVYWTLTSSWKGPERNRRYLITDPVKRHSYISNAIIPLIGTLKSSRYFDRVFAIDIHNEIENEIKWTANGSWGGEITWEQAYEYINAVSAAIKSAAPKLLVTSSSGYHGLENIKAGRFNNLNLDFLDGHVYTDSGKLKYSWKELNVNKPVLIGEIGQNSDKWDDELQNKAVGNLINEAWNKGYAGVLQWCYGYPGTDEIHSLVYSNGSFRPVASTMRKFDEEHRDIINIGYARSKRE